MMHVVAPYCKGPEGSVLNADGYVSWEGIIHMSCHNVFYWGQMFSISMFYVFITSLILTIVIRNLPDLI